MRSIRDAHSRRFLVTSTASATSYACLRKRMVARGRWVKRSFLRRGRPPKLQPTSLHLISLLFEHARVLKTSITTWRQPKRTDHKPVILAPLERRIGRRRRLERLSQSAACSASVRTMTLRPVMYSHLDQLAYRNRNHSSLVSSRSSIERSRSRIQSIEASPVGSSFPTT